MVHHPKAWANYRPTLYLVYPTKYETRRLLKKVSDFQNVHIITTYPDILTHILFK